MMRLQLAVERLALLDLALTGLANRINRRRFCSRFFGTVSRLGDGVFWYVLMFALPAVDGMAAAAAVLHMIVAGLAGTAIYKVLKTASSRPRPFMRAPELRLSTAPLDQFSFPSGHTLHAVCFTWICSAYYPALLWPLAVFTALVAVSRLVLGLHYISDVIAGALIGGVMASGTLFLFAR